MRAETNTRLHTICSTLVVLMLSTVGVVNVAAQGIRCPEEIYADSSSIIESYREVYSDGVFNSGRVYTNGENDIYITNSNVVFVSNDRGMSWRVGFYGTAINKWFVDAVVVDDTTFIGVGFEGLLVRSTDRGHTFETVKTGHDRILTTIGAWGRTVVYVDNIVAEIVISTDAGASWFRRPIDTNGLPPKWGILEICVAGPKAVLLPIGLPKDRLTIVTTDLGMTWSLYPACGSGRVVEHFSESVGLSVGSEGYKYNPDGTLADDRSYGCVYKTTDGGKTYRMVLVDSTRPIFGFNGLTIHPNGMAFVSGPEKCYVSWNYGDLWVKSTDVFDTNPHGYGTPNFMKDGRVFAFFALSVMLDFAIRGSNATTVSEYREPETGERCTQVQVYDMMGRLLATSQPGEVVTVKAILERHHSELPIAPVFILATTEHGEQLRSAVHPAIHVK